MCCLMAPPKGLVQGRTLRIFPTSLLQGPVLDNLSEVPLGQGGVTAGAPPLSKCAFASHCARDLDEAGTSLPPGVTGGSCPEMPHPAGLGAGGEICGGGGLWGAWPGCLHLSYLIHSFNDRRCQGGFSKETVRR